MKRDLPKQRCPTPVRCLFAAVALLVISFTGCKGKEMTMNPSTVSASTIPNAEGLSVGRLTLHAPMISRVWFGNVKISDVELSLVPLDGKSLGEWITARQSKIRAEDGRGGSRDPFLRSYSLSDHLPATLSWKFPNANFQQLEAYRQVNDHVLLGSTVGLPNERLLSERLVTSVLDSFEQHSPTYIASSGFGIDGGLLHKTFDNNESANATAALHLDGTSTDPKEQPQIDITTEVFGDTAPSTLPARAKFSEEVLARTKSAWPGFTSKTIRQGPRTVAGLAGQESFVVFQDTRSDSAKHGFSAEFEYGGDANNPLRPYLKIEFKGSLEKNQADGSAVLRIWDQVLQSTALHP